LLAVTPHPTPFGVSFAPLGLAHFPHHYPRLAPWALFFRRFAAGEREIMDGVSILRT